jgi:Xaa-Pro aminopeptidase
MYKERRDKILESLEDESILILSSGTKSLKSRDQTYPFFVNNNYFYLTGNKEEDSFLIIIKSTFNATKIFVPLTDIEHYKWFGKYLDTSEVSKESELEVNNCLENSLFYPFIFDILNDTRKNIYGNIKNIYLDFSNDSNYKKILDSLNDKYPYLVKKNIAPVITKSRMVKDSYEIDEIKEAIAVTKVALDEVRKNLGSRDNEKDIVNDFEISVKKQYHELSFDSICASGINAISLHYSANNAKVSENDLVLLDVGVYHNKYASDISRTYPKNGKFSSKQRSVYELVLNCNKEAIKFLKSGVHMVEYFNFGNKYLAQGLIKLGLIKEESEVSKYYYHNIGHYLGLDVHDVTINSLPIPEGAVITCEPGLYIEEWGIGIRIEDDILITKNGSINLSVDIPKEIKDIEF